jgi:hypothetical protein
MQLLEGKLAHSTAMMTGKIRIEGEPFFSMMLASIVAQFRKLATGPGRLGRAFTGFVLRRVRPSGEKP